MLDDARRTAKGYLGAVKASEGAGVVEAVGTDREAVVVLKAVAAHNFIQYCCPKTKPGLHFRLEKGVEAEG
jgi:hypothetical protein